MSPMRSGRNTHGRGRARLAERACTPGATGADGGGPAEPSPNGGNGVIRATTRRRHAANQLLMLQNPHRIRCNERQTEPGCSTRGYGRGARGRRKLDTWTHGRRHGGTKLAQQEPCRATAVQNSPSTSRTTPLPVQNSPSTHILTACARQNSPCSPKMAQFGAFCPCMANFLPLSPPTSHAGRTLYRIQAGCGSSKHNNTTDHTSVKVSRGSNK